MTITMDLYKQLGLDRSWDEKKIRATLTGEQNQWIKRQNACNDKEQLLLIEKMMETLEQAFRFLTKPLKRKQYDKALEEAYKKGTIEDEKEEKMKSVLEQAVAYYRKGNIKLAAKYAQEAVDGKVNEPLAWDTLARCHYSMENYEKALNTVDDGLKIFGDNLNLNWLGARIATVGMENFEDAQRRINHLLEIAPDNAIGYSEQIFLHLSKENEELAFQETDKFITEHPNDNTFKRNIAYDIINFSNTSFVQDPKSRTYIIADKAGYERCLKMREKAKEIYSDDYTEKQLEKARYYGKLEFNKDNLNDLLWTYGVFLYVFAALIVNTVNGFVEGGAAGGLTSITFIFALLSIVLAVPPVTLTFASFRPYWQLNRIYLTGDPGFAEKAAVWFGRTYTWLIKKALWLIGTICKYIFLLIIRITTRGI